MNIAAIFAEALRAPAVRDALREVLRVDEDRWLSLRDAAIYAGWSEEDADDGARVIADDGRRGRREIGHAGRSPRIRRSEIDRWISTRVVHRDAKPQNDDPKADAKGAVARAAQRWGAR